MFDLSKKWIKTIELSGPHGASLGNCEAEVAAWKADAYNVPHCALGRLTAQSIIVAGMLGKKFKETFIPHFTCRNRTLLAMQSELLGAEIMGIKNILLMGGDKTPDTFDPKLYAVNLIELVNKLNNGNDAEGKELSGRTDLTAGCVVNPSDSDPKEVDFLRQKIEAGAKFIQTQPGFDAEKVHNFLDRLGEISIPLLIGVMPLKGYKNAKFLHEKVHGIELPESVLARMKQDDSAGVDVAIEFVEGVKDRVSGIHVMPLGDVGAGEMILKEF